MSQREKNLLNKKMLFPLVSALLAFPALPLARHPRTRPIRAVASEARRECTLYVTTPREASPITMVVTQMVDRRFAYNVSYNEAHATVYNARIAAGILLATMRHLDAESNRTALRGTLTTASGMALVTLVILHTPHASDKCTVRDVAEVVESVVEASFDASRAVRDRDGEATDAHGLTRAELTRFDERAPMGGVVAPVPEEVTRRAYAYLAAHGRGDLYRWGMTPRQAMAALGVEAF